MNAQNERRGIIFRTTGGSQREEREGRKYCRGTKRRLKE